MKVRFIGNALVNSDGEEIDVHYKELLEECLASITTLSTAEIIIKAVEKLTGLKFNRYNYRQSEFFNSLEEAIRANEKYKKLKQQKDEFLERQKKGREREREKREIDYAVSNTMYRIYKQRKICQVINQRKITHVD